MPGEVRRDCAVYAIDSATEKDRMGLPPAPRGALGKLQLAGREDPDWLVERVSAA